MDIPSLLKKVRLIELKSRHLSDHYFSGTTLAVAKGRGMEFSEVREYQYGDEIRTIDWNVTARFNAPYVKVFHEEKERVIMLMIDVSKSMLTNSTYQSKRATLIETIATLAFSAAYNNDKVGALFFSNQVEQYIAPKKGKKHIYTIISTLLNAKPNELTTNIETSIQMYASMLRKRTTLFVLSDCLMDDSFKQTILSLKMKHEVNVIQITDLFEEEFPNIGLIELTDTETKETVWVNTSDAKIRAELKESRSMRNAQIQHFFRKNNLNFAVIKAGEDAFTTLNHLHKSRK